MICVNDMSMDIDFERIKKEIKESFELILGEKSEFELQRGTFPAPQGVQANTE